MEADVTANWRDLPVLDYLQALGSSAPTPGGGSAASLSGALAAALGRMVIAVAQEKDPSPERGALAEVLQDAESRFLSLAEEDERAFSDVMEALRIPRDAPERAARRETALEVAAAVPLRVAELAVAVLERLAEAEGHASRAIVSDVGVAAHLALAASLSSLLNVAANARSLRDPAVAGRLRHDAAALEAAARRAHADVLCRVEARLAPKAA
jgi:formiminotetrahydrofolate cyclodeaminase